MNVLVYSGPGTTVESVKHCTDSLRRFLSPNYAVLNVTSSVIVNEPWANSTSLLVIPGGADLPYCRELDGKGTDSILKFVRQGGRYLGFCAGGYYGSARVEFEVGNKEMEVSGPRKLGFFPGTARGAVYKGFKYGSHVGTRAVAVKVNNESLGQGAADFRSHFNGGCCFIDADKYSDDGVEVLAYYDEKPDIEWGPGKPAAAVFCKINKGNAVLTGIHPEFVPDLLKSDFSEKDYTEVIEKLKQDNSKRVSFLHLTLEKMGLKVNAKESPAPLLTRLYLSSIYPPALQYLIENLKNKIGFTGALENILEGNNDKFRLWDSSQANLEAQQLDGPPQSIDDIFLDLNKVIKDVDVYYSGYPEHRSTPYFNHELYFNNLEKSRKEAKYAVGDLGSTILYGEVVTSTSTMLDKNYNILSNLPNGLAAIGTIQVSGRGRGNNVWVNPIGVLAVSTVLRLPLTASTDSPIVFIQYLVSLAMVEAIRSYGPGYEDMPIRLKWPNDIYAENPSKQGIDVGQTQSADDYLKVGGVIVNSNILDGEYVLVFGLGVNVSNRAPSTSLNLILDALNVNRKKQGKPVLPDYQQEILLSKFMTGLEEMLTVFRYQGFKAFEELYYKRWLHSDKLVTLEQHENTKAKIKGITMDYGMLLVEEVDREGRLLGRTFELQPDGNSFDMMKGLLKKKQ